MLKGTWSSRNKKKVVFETEEEWIGLCVTGNNTTEKMLSKQQSGGPLRMRKELSESLRWVGWDSKHRWWDQLITIYKNRGKREHRQGFGNKKLREFPSDAFLLFSSGSRREIHLFKMRSQESTMLGQNAEFSQNRGGREEEACQGTRDTGRLHEMSALAPTCSSEVMFLAVPGCFSYKLGEGAAMHHQDLWECLLLTPLTVGSKPDNDNQRTRKDEGWAGRGLT